MAGPEDTVILPRNRLFANEPHVATNADRAAADASSTEGGAEKRYFGKYELLQEVGRGGMGVVYRAREIGLGRTVALKVMLSDSALNAERFRHETQAVARLQHPNIAAIHEVGSFEGQSYYTMDFINGPSLDQRLKAGPLPLREAAVYVQVLAKAVHYAHAHNILHRDLKPANVLLKQATFDGVTRGTVGQAVEVTSIPILTDFGLAKDLSAQVQNTESGTMVGTPNYMAPEQALGKIHELGPPTDVWGLGALLYELITGTPPFSASNILETARRILEDDPLPPRQLVPTIDADLDAICLKCLEKEPGNRYVSAQALADDLGRFLAREPISVRRPSFLDRVARMLAFSHLDAPVRAWGATLLALAALMLVVQVGLFVLTICNPLDFGLTTLGVRTLELAFVGLLLGAQYRRLAPRCPADRQLWTIWLGFVAACVLSAVLQSRTLGPVSVAAELHLYPQWAILSGLAFLVTGASFWGRAYAYGTLFFLLAMCLPIQGAFAPLSFGLVWGAALFDIGVHLRFRATLEHG